MKTKACLLTIIFLLVNLIILSQNCESISVDNSLFLKKSSPFKFSEVIGNMVRCTNNESIKDVYKIASIDNNCLKINICYGCCQDKEIKLVTNGILQQDIKGNKFYNVKIYFYNRDICDMLCHTNLKIDLFSLKLPDSKTFIRLEDFDQLLEIK